MRDLTGKNVLIQCNLEGNEDEPFVGMKGYVTKHKGEWCIVVLENPTQYGKKFRFHVKELTEENELVVSE